MRERIPARAFEPPPSVDAALLTIYRRSEPLLPVLHSRKFAAFVGRGFSGDRPVLRSLGPIYSAGRLKAVASVSGFRAEAKASDLSLENWVRLFQELEMKGD